MKWMLFACMIIAEAAYSMQHNTHNQQNHHSQQESPSPQERILHDNRRLMMAIHISSKAGTKRFRSSSELRLLLIPPQEEEI